MLFDFDDFEVRDRFYEIEEKNQIVQNLLTGIEPKEQEKLTNVFHSAYIYHDNALDGLVVGNKELNFIFGNNKVEKFIRHTLYHELTNHKELLVNHINRLFKVKDFDKIHRCEVLHIQQIIDMHCSLYNNLEQKSPGKFRKNQPPQSSYLHDFEQANKIGLLLQELCGYTEQYEFQSQHPINQAALFHYKFMQIYPFAKGSGKLGRLLLNGFLLQGGYDIVIIHSSERQRYYQALSDGPNELREILLSNMESCLDNRINYLNNNSLRKPLSNIYESNVGFMRG